MKGVMGYRRFSSTCFLIRTSIVDANAGIGLNSTFKIISWYDNEDIQVN
jgi:glyceraldehyde 3-phosphate dehydrogenase